MDSEIRVVERGKGIIRFRYRDGVLTGNYMLMIFPGREIFECIYDHYGVSVGTERGQVIALGLKKAGVIE